jgi:hypothetical protein
MVSAATATPLDRIRLIMLWIPVELEAAPKRLALINWDAGPNVA